jgi:hypothetical protein
LVGGVTNREEDDMTPLLQHDWDMIKGDAGHLWRSILIFWGDTLRLILIRIRRYLT